MKIRSLVTGLCLFGAAMTAKANYDITFATYDLADLTQHLVFDAGGSNAVTGPAFLGQLYVGANAGSLGKIGAPVAFSDGGPTSAPAGFIDSGTITVTDPTLSAGNSAVYVFRAWNASAGSSFEAASLVEGAHAGSSALTPITLGGTVPGTPPQLLTATANLHPSFTLAVVHVPEPSAVALGLIGGVALLLRRRK